ncbi:hypothetical protein EP331_13940 [bacterium]|nr:MAG: hypothetical protein EP331_13940 [bacterium]
MMQNQFPRMFAYSALTLMMGALYYVFTHGFYQYVELGGLYGVGTWLGLVVTIIPVNYALGKRFLTKAFTHEYFPYVMSFIFALPIVLQILIREEVGVSDLQPVLFTIVIIAAAIGAYFGISKGKIARAVLLKKIQAKQAQNTAK